MNDPVRVWRQLRDDSVLLDGFHALKHAVRFGARVPVAVTTDRPHGPRTGRMNSPPTYVPLSTGC